ncbi:ATP-dependent bile acid permease [Lasiodiplodia theobromae]|uniref:ATP-dependent bile acid permease n=1 Tax=Lasiodiplodia theobromae TaxID=45133 RepID=UPI0015C3893B|nr:ATP-dependent bile acid permease [Lasiodiplodia theobromae]KAF4543365.1 ATP-dependent bile acid permease [Lasiodiplodia theobromae]
MGSAMDLKRIELNPARPAVPAPGRGQRLVDMYNTPFFHLGAVGRWLGVRIDVLGSGVSLACSTFVVCRTGAGRMDAGAAGLAMSYAATFTGNLLWLIRLHTANEQDMNLMERVGEYLDVPQEGPTAVPAKGWAGGQGGSAIEFVDYSAHYGKERETVLRNLRLSIGAREKIGVVGRTGPGKTSLALALVRALP